jgi:hypothetical protein
MFTWLQLNLSNSVNRLPDRPPADLVKRPDFHNIRAMASFALRKFPTA